MQEIARWISSVAHGLGADWFRNLVTLASFVLAALAFRQGRPRVRVTQHTAGVVHSLGGGSASKWAGRPVISVTVTNDSPRPVVIQTVTAELSNGQVLHGETVPAAAEPGADVVLPGPTR